jgi:MFS transporter, OFA family, oxalate/formate antiporter
LQVSGLMDNRQVAAVACEFSVADMPVSMLGLTLAVLTFALMMDRVMNGLTRPLFGWMSDRTYVLIGLP